MLMVLPLFLVVATLITWGFLRAASLKPAPVQSVNLARSVDEAVKLVLERESRLAAAQVTRRLRKSGWAIGRAAVRSVLNQVAYATRTKRGRLLYS